MARRKKSARNHGFQPKPILDLSGGTKKGVGAVLFLGFAVVIFLSFWDKAGIFGQYVSSSFSYLFGWGYLFLPLILVLIAFEFLRTERQFFYFPVIFGAAIFFVSVLSLLNFFWSGNPGGLVGFGAALVLDKFFGFWASLILLASFIIISLLIVLDLPLNLGLQRKEKDFEENVKVNIPQAPKPIDSESGAIKIKTAQAPILQPLSVSSREEEDLKLLKVITRDYKPLPLELLEREETQPKAGDIKAGANIIKKTLENFGVSVEMGEVNVGPTVTQYTLKPAQGMKLSRIVALQNDLSLALAAHPLRIEAPIPSKALVGIEVPNRSVALVRLGNLIAEEEFLKSSRPLNLVLGRDVAGEPVYTDLGKMPHLLIAGATGAGKSVCIHNLVISLLWRNSPNRLKFIFIDPKRVELSRYNKIPHLLTPVIHDGKRAVNALKWSVKEMEHRYELLSGRGVRDLEGYNEAILKEKKSGQNVLPYIVIIIDELADLMAAYGREVEGIIIRIAQMARATGIHLVVSTQRPSVEVITGLIKANITTRLAFQVASQVDSRTILDTSGSEKLLGNGDLLYLSAEASKPRRLQASFVSEKEVGRVVDYLRKLDIEETASDAEIKTPEDIAGFEKDREKSLFETHINELGGDLEDEFYDDAKVVVLEARKASASLLQRRLRVGYARAARLLDLLEARGIVGPGDGAKPREVFNESNTEK